ncbi:DUF1667 domain-containing protein [Eubacteriales bacterium OttesenSCG-928-A19]|nr:DUF1667 domain-containing protein [Eubacteriales bacterium OttesenSCG-928-A19]
MAQEREMTCIACPMGCRIMVRQDDNGKVTVENATCKRGVVYGEQEFTCPMRTVTSSVRVEGGHHPLCAVKTRDTVPKEKIPQVLEEIRTVRPKAPVALGQVIVPDIAGTGVDLIATSACE